MTVPDDSWALFAVDLVEPPTERHPDLYLMWAGTNHAVVNELMCQALKRDAYPFDLTNFNLVAEGENGLLFGLTPELYKDAEFRRRLEETFSAAARGAAEQQGYDFHVADPDAYHEGFMFMAARASVYASRHPEALGGPDGEEGKEEE